MRYEPKLLTAVIKGTGRPIDGHVLMLAVYDYDPEHYHLYGWDKKATEAVMLTFWELEQKNPESSYKNLADFTKAWKDKMYHSKVSIILNEEDLDQDSIKVGQEEHMEGAPSEEEGKMALVFRKKLMRAGIDLGAASTGIIMMPLKDAIKGDVQAKHPDWWIVKCPVCGKRCWSMPSFQKMKEKEGAQFICTKCAIKAGFMDPLPGVQKLGGNRAARRARRK